MVDPAKIEALMQWEVLRSPYKIRSFLGLVGYYQRFIWELLRDCSSLDPTNKEFSDLLLGA